MQSAKTRICSGPTALFSRSSVRFTVAAAVRGPFMGAQYNPSPLSLPEAAQDTNAILSIQR